MVTGYKSSLSLLSRMAVGVAVAMLCGLVVMSVFSLTDQIRVRDDGRTPYSVFLPVFSLATDTPAPSPDTSARQPRPRLHPDADRQHPPASLRFKGRPTPQDEPGAIAMPPFPAPSWMTKDDPVPESPDAMPPASPVGPLDLSSSTLRNAAKAAIASAPRDADDLYVGIRESRAERQARMIKRAGIPDCLRADALRHNPPAIGPIVLSGVLVAPFVAEAALRGKCMP